MIGALVSLVLIATLQLLTSAWWWILIVPFVYGFFSKGFVWRTVLLEGAVVALGWMSVALWQWLTVGERIVARIADLMGVPGGWVLVVLTAVVAFLVAGLATYAGLSFRQLVWQERQIS
jgi:hypothetical protein